MEEQVAGILSETNFTHGDWVIVGGLGDIKRLFARMNDDHKNTESSV